MTADHATQSKLRWASVALFVLLPFVLAGVTVFNFAQVAQGWSRMSQQEALLRRLEERLVRTADAPLEEDVRGIYLSATSPTLAQAELQQLIAKLIDRASGRLIEAQVVSETEDDRAARVRVSFDSTNAKLFDLLYAIETGVPLLSIEQISLRKLPTQESGREDDPVLRVSFVVRGHLKEPTL